MTRPRARIGAELAPVLLVLACLAGSWGLIVSAYRKPVAKRKPEPKVAEVSAPAPEPKAPPPVVLPPPPPDPVQEEDPTPGVLARIAAQTAEETRAAQEADRRAAALEKAKASALADAAKWRRREMLVRKQANELDLKAQAAETEAETLALEYDVLLRETERTKEQLNQLRSKAQSSFAILPYKGSNGTWQRPIAIECREGEAILQPNNISFGLTELDTIVNFRGNRFLSALAHQLVKIQGTATPDGAPAVPYILFIVRPDGIKSYYLARALLEPLGVQFGYELVDQDLDVDYPDLNDLAEWDGSTTPSAPRVASPWPGQGPNTPMPMPNPYGGPGGPGPDTPRASIVYQAPGRSGSSLNPEDIGGSPPANAMERALRGPDFYREDRNGRPSAGRSRGPSGSEPGSGSRNRFGGLARGLGRRGDNSDVPPQPNGWSGRIGQRHGSLIDELDPSSSTPDPRQLAELDQEEQQNTSSLPFPSAPSPRGEVALSQPPAGTATAPGVQNPGNGGGRSLGQSRGPGRGTSSSPSRGATAGESSSKPPSEAVPAEANASSLPPPAVIEGLKPITDGKPGVLQAVPSVASGSPPVSSSSGGMPMPFPMTSSSDDPGARDHRLTPPPMGMPDIVHQPERVLEMVVVCGPNGVTIQPGGYRVSLPNLKAGDGYLVKQLQGIVRRKRQAKPDVFWEPRLKFLVERGGEATYREVRKQTILAATGWPISLQVAEDDQLKLLSRSDEQEGR